MAAGPGHPKTLAGDALQRAAHALGAQRPQEAQRIAEEFLRAEPRRGRALHILGCALLMQGRAEDSIAPLEAAARGRHDPEIETQLAMALAQTGRQEDALSRLKRTLKRHPAYAPAWHGLGSLLVSMQRYGEAIEALRRGVAAAPLMPEMSLQLGNVHLQQKNYAEAKAAFAQTLAIIPGFAEALFGLGKAHYATGDNAAAADCFRRCLRSSPDHNTAWLHLGHCLLELGEREAGEDCFRAAARGDAKRYGRALASLAASGRGRAWLRPSAAARFLRGEKS
jgi:tetratricopeptide (TPR) repeat protein